MNQKETRLEQDGEGRATRTASENRYDPEGYLSPLSIERFAEYMQKNQYQADGSKRESDNWQKGMPERRLMQGLWRHFLHLWTRHRGFEPTDVNAGEDIQEDLCAIIWGAQAMLHQRLVAERENPMTTVRKVECLSDYEQPED